MKDARVTAKEHPLGAFVCVRAKNMEEPWFLATNLGASTASQVVNLYGRRFTIEETFRDLKDPRFGLGMSGTHIRAPKRRDRLILLFALSHALLTLLGAASEQTGLDAKLKVNTSRKRTHSLFRQGLYWYTAIPNMPEQRLRVLMEAFSRLVAEQPVMRQTFATI
jgi:hypothetical protein